MSHTGAEAIVKKKANTPRPCICEVCKSGFISAGRAAKYCEACAADVYLEKSKRRQRSYAAKRGVKRIGAELTCLDCGSLFASRGGRHSRCDNCATVHRKISNIARSEHRARKAGVVKRRHISCKKCGDYFLAWSVMNIYCVRCSKEAEREATRERTRERLIADGRSPIGSRLACQNCGALFVKSAGPKIYCNPCAETRRCRWVNAKMTSDAKYAINARISRSIRHSLSSGGKRGKKLLALVGFTIDQLMIHLEKQFVHGMNWKNRSLWHIDHIVPLADHQFSTIDDDGFKAAWALTNLRPLWSIENLHKSDKRLHLI